MAEEEVVVEGAEETTVRSVRRHPARRAAIWVGRLLALLLAILALAVLFLHTGSGRQFIVDQIAKVAPASGLSVSVGRIEGSVLWNATLHDVEFRDAEGTLFLEVPEVELNWRPYKFLYAGLDVRSLVLHDGTLYAAPELNPGDPDAPILPDFDIRVDQFVIDDLRVVEGLLGEERIIDFRAEADIRDGLVYLNAKGELGGGDKLEALINVEPDGDRFDIDFDYRAPEGGFLASLVGAEEDLSAHLRGTGTWERWDGAFVASGAGERIAAFRLFNRAGRYRISGQAWPGEYLTGAPARALGEVVSVAAIGTLKDSVLEGSFALRGRAVAAEAEGVIDLADNAFDDVELTARLLEPELLGEGMSLEDTQLEATIDGPFQSFDMAHILRVGRANLSGTIIDGLVQRGTLVYDGTRWVLPLNATVQRIRSGNEVLDPRLVNGTLDGTLVWTGDRLLSDRLTISFPGVDARLALRGNMATGAYELAGPIEIRRLELEGIGTVNAGAQIAFRTGGDRPWTLQANFTGRIPRVTNATLANLAGENIRFDGGVTLGADRPIVFRRTTLTGSKLTLLVEGRVDGGETSIIGSGRHVDYGPFTVEAALTGEGPRAELVFADPFPAAGLRDVRVALSPTEDGFRVETSGASMLGPFDGLLNLYAPEDGPTRIEIEQLEIWRTNVTGEVVLGEGAASGTLALAGGGLDGTITLAPRGGGQGFALDLTANNARFGGDTPLAIRRAEIDVSGFFAEGSSTIQGTVRAQGVSYGTLFIGRLSASADVTDGRGTFNASLAGRRGSRFQLQLTGEIAPERIALAVRGSYGGRPISMPRRAVLLKQPDGGWELQKTQINFADGIAIVEGSFGGEDGPQGRVALAEMPLSLLDVVLSDIGLGGSISGLIEFQQTPGGRFTGEAAVKIDDLTRSGLLLTSRPVDLALVARLSPTLAQARAVIENNGETMGRFQGRIANLPQDGSLLERLSAGDLFAQLRYEGPADALWRLAALDAFDITGTLRLAADVRGSLTSPQVRGSLAGDSLRVQSSLTGTDLRGVRARGRFSGSRLQLTSFAGTAPNGGSVIGSGIVDLADMGGGRGPRLDLRLAARSAEILDLATMGATVTGPMRIVSDGVGGTIAGRLTVNEARWRLGAASGVEELPNISTREINLPADVAPPAAPGAPWRYLIDAVADDRVEVDGMGLDSEWSADIMLRGTTAEPRIGGTARIVPRQGFYSFAGTRFEITRGLIDFNRNSPPDPQIDLVAEAETESSGITVQVEVAGSAAAPEITFSSNPSLPQEEILAQLLFGGSIADLSATDALQLGAALASLRGGGGLDPINQLRSAIGLDRLRIVAADPALDRGTALALGKRFGRRFYVEVITDGRGYTATEVEFRITSWLSLLATISSLGRESVALEYSRDY